MERSFFMKKILLFIAITVMACLAFTMSTFAASTNEFGTVEIVSGIDLSK